MSFDFRLPDLAEGMTEAEIVSWKVNVGDTVSLDQPVVEVMSDKATVEIPSPRAGTIAKLNYSAGDICPVGDVLFVIEEVGGKAEAPAAAPHTATPVPSPPVPSPNQGHRPEIIDASADRTRVLATPATRRLARNLGVDLTALSGSGRNGRVTTDDVKRAQGGSQSQPANHTTVQQNQPQVRTAEIPASVPAGGVPGAVAPGITAQHTYAPQGFEPQAQEERIPFRGMRKRIAENMARSAFTAAHFTYVEEVDTSDLVAVRQRAKLRAEERGIKLTYLPYIVKAVVNGLKKWPSLNSSLDEKTQEIVRKGYYHIGIATQGPSGLAVTVVRDADKRSIFDIAREIDRLATAVQNGNATRDDLSGSTFTISSLGKLGGVMATPIINFPEVGIMGVHKMEERAVVVDGAIVPRWRMNLSISLDHRLVDGWDGAMFLQDVKSLLEDPTLMFMEMV